MGNPCKATTCDASSLEKVGIIFAGLGSSYLGMLDELIHNSKALNLLRKASDILEIDIEESICASHSGEPEKLEEIKIAQSIVTVTNLMAAELMRQKAALEISKASIVTGFSVGEFAALCFAGAISLEDTLRLVKIQSDTLNDISVRSTLCTIRGLSLERLCKKFDCRIAKIICDHEDKASSINNVYVCGGKLHGIDAMVSFVNNDVTDLEDSKISAKRLHVNAAHHTFLMKPAVRKFRLAVEKTQILFPERAYSNVTGRPYRSVTEIRENLVLQMTHSVQWHETITDMFEQENCRTFLECGSMRSQSSILKLVLNDAFSSGQIRILSSDENLQVANTNE